ncbi:hypothetical protein HDV05_002540 [Chytridiales sp. JEL 0842]|nr:hypothetical protein HDV05_002540 [Chytridiales sp. JEL 0842]
MAADDGRYKLRIGKEAFTVPPTWTQINRMAQMLNRGVYNAVIPDTLNPIDPITPNHVYPLCLPKPPPTHPFGQLLRPITADPGMIQQAIDHANKVAELAGNDLVESEAAGEAKSENKKKNKKKKKRQNKNNAAEEEGIAQESANRAYEVSTNEPLVTEVLSPAISSHSTESEDQPNQMSSTDLLHRPSTPPTPQEIQLSDIMTVLNRLQKSIEELKANFSDLRAEVRGDISNLRAEVRGDISNLSAEFRGSISDLRAEFHCIASDLYENRGRMASTQFLERSHPKWTMLVPSTGKGNINFRSSMMPATSRKPFEELFNNNVPQNFEGNKRQAFPLTIECDLVVKFIDNLLQGESPQFTSQWSSQASSTESLAPKESNANTIYSRRMFHHLAIAEITWTKSLPCSAEECRNPKGKDYGLLLFKFMQLERICWALNDYYNGKHLVKAVVIVSPSFRVLQRPSEIIKHVVTSNAAAFPALSALANQNQVWLIPA